MVTTALGGRLVDAAGRERARAAGQSDRYLVNKLESYGFIRPDRKFPYQRVFGQEAHRK